MSLSDIATIAGAVFAGISALIAAAAIYFPSRTNKSQLTLEQATISLKRAYETLTNDGSEMCPPPPDRLNWLTAARQIERYKELKRAITDSTHKIVCEEQEEYWRHKFYMSLQSERLFQSAYYQEQPGPPCKSGLEPRSAMVVHAFAKWPEERTDPIDSVDIDALLNKSKALEGNYGLRAYLAGLPKYSGKVSLGK